MARIDEKEIVNRIREAFPGGRARVGIGDDAAVLDLGPGTVVTTDALVENVDFTRSIPVGFIAAKSLAVNLSDVASMGAVPDSFTVALVAPDWFLERIDSFIAGLAAAAASCGIELVGGDLSSGSIALISITAIGRIHSRPLLRNGAIPGDRIFVSRDLGGATAGLQLLQRGWGIDADGRVIAPTGQRPGFEQRAFAEAAIRHQVDPRAECELGPRLAAVDLVHSCIDISDGLSTDLSRLCDASGVGALVEWERIPTFGGLESVGRSLIDPDHAAIHGGEELALLFTADARESKLSSLLGRPVFQIGRITEEKGVIQLERDGIRTPLEPGGFDHFG